MGRKKNEIEETDNNEVNELASKLGGTLLSQTESVPYFIDTGSLALNFILSSKFINGGFCGGPRIHQIYGSSSSGKSLIATNVLRGAEKHNNILIYLDCENTLSKEFAEAASHVNPENVICFRTPTLQESFLKIHNVLKHVKEMKGNRSATIVYDSLAVSSSERELRETELPEDYTDADFKRIVMGKEQPGERAKLIGTELRKLNSSLPETKSTVLLLNQTRTSIGSYGDPTVKAAGGASLDFYCTSIIRSYVQKKIENSRGLVCGVNLKFKCEKNKVSIPFRSCDGVQIFFDKGINACSGMLELLVQTDRVDPLKAGWYKVREKYSEGKEVLFRASKEKNSVDPEVLIKCPGLIDATSSQEVEDYLSLAQSAIEEGNSDNIVEKVVESELM